MKKTKLICLLLALVFVCASFAACGDDSGVIDNSSKGERGEGGSWENVDFEGKTLKVEVSAAQDPQGTFPAADIYTKGPDEASTDEIQKKVLSRNARAESELNLKVEYTTSDLLYSEVLEHVQKFVQGSAEDSPDIIDNDTLGMTRAVLNGYFWNVSNPGKDTTGEDVYSYFDFTTPGWYLEYMKGTTLDPNKMFLTASEFNLDIIRYAWVLFVNVDRFNETFASTDYGTYVDFCQYITEANEFYYEDLLYVAKVGWKDTINKDSVDEKDEQIGVCLNALAPRLFQSAAGVSMFEWSGGEWGVGTPSVVQAGTEGANKLAAFSELYTDMYNAEGMLRYGFQIGGNVLESTTTFFNGNVILTMAKLGEMESQEMRGTPFERGVVPFPQYNRQAPGFRTIVHDQAELSGILNNTKSFTMSSAYLQFMSENSSDVLTEYYEKGLKFKYNESRTTREMIDFIKDHIATPFEMVMNMYVCQTSAVGKQLYDIFDQAAKQQNNSFASTYNANASSYQVRLQELIDLMAMIE